MARIAGGRARPRGWVTLFAGAAAAWLLLALHAAWAEEPLTAWRKPTLDVPWLTPEVLAQVFPGATRVGPMAGDPKAAPVSRRGDGGEELAGYLFVTRDIVDTLGFSSQPFTIVVGLYVSGHLAGAKVIDHDEPIIDLIMLQDLVPAFAQQYADLDIRRSWRVSLTRVEDEGTLDGISSATISAVLFNEAILRSARLVARSRGVSIVDKPMVDTINFEPRPFADLLAEGSVAHVEVTREQLDQAGTVAPDFAGGPMVSVYELAEARSNRHLRPAGAAAAQAQYAKGGGFELFMAEVLPPSVGRNVLSDTWYNLFVSRHPPEELVLMIGIIGGYSLDGPVRTYSGPFKRLRVVQGEKAVTLDKDNWRYLGFLHGKGKPKFTENGLFWIPPEAGIDPLLPFTLEYRLERSDGAEPAVFKLPYQLGSRYILQPVAGAAQLADEPAPAWLAAWQSQRVNLIILGFALAILTVVMVLMDPLSRRPRLYRVVRYGFLLFTLVWLGWTVGAQVTVIQVLTWLHALVSGVTGKFSLDAFLIDPLIAMLMAYVLITFVIWGRGVFCGWLCPFGALQELLGKIAGFLRVPQIELSHGSHRLLWPVKYVVLAVLVGLSFYSMTVASTASEIEPFKTAISLKFVRDWPFVLYAATLVAAGLTVERFFCRFLCPLGAFMAVGGKLRVFQWLKRRNECGSPCRLCEHKCPIQAIEPDGKIKMDECFYCLDCQVVYYDEHLCPPLVQQRRRRSAAGVAVAAE